MSDWADTPVCPHCGTADHDWWDGLSPSIGDGDTFPVMCGSCNAEYEAVMCVATTFTSRTAQEHEHE